MENIKDLLTSEQMDMLIHDIGYSDIVALFLMNEEDKYRYFVEKFNEFSNRHGEYLSKFNIIHEKYLELESSHNPERDTYSYLQHSLLENMQRCNDFMKIY